jgi:hypothetical protein
MHLEELCTPKNPPWDGLPPGSFIRGKTAPLMGPPTSRTPFDFPEFGNGEISGEMQRAFGGMEKFLQERREVSGEWRNFSAKAEEFRWNGENFWGNADDFRGDVEISEGMRRTFGGMQKVLGGCRGPLGKWRNFRGNAEIVRGMQKYAVAGWSKLSGAPA